ncbi:MAG: cell division transport system ATP-binding protein [Parcubacteria group bacterium Gr01-1014_18]|nr:MAG: cell division transport system ATP-binding protein [Parcubacteria group bacterium Greene0416_36]TSC81099.1 MAG: cell division transport system ATP-binding protein [Parcubacteria group bacterium Gr01-1014_18]TSC98485.1 MAG: cell division transport system ATP-binding protein [Parcubacteria group bacterium Greene1014_20]TSD07350.1 MAG: cell division transport system ATP-binding protein [Parcubacteria group bacterium Greene0714_2]
MIQLVGVSKKYGPDQYALRDINFHIHPGEFVSLVGPSGTGKTTLAKLLISEIKPTEGTVTIGGWDITHISSYEVPMLRRQIGVVFQDFNLLPKKTVFENVAFSLEVLGESYRQIRDIVPEVLDIVGLGDNLDRYPMHLSGGEKQRVAVARSLVHRPKILIADEPTGNLDDNNTREVIDLLRKVNELGTTVVLITHNRAVVDSLGHRVITLRDGTLYSDEEKGKYHV